MAVSKNKKNNIVIAKRSYPNTAFNSAGYAQLDTIGAIATALNKPELNNYTLIGMMVQGFDNGNIYGLARGSTQTAIYAIGKPSASATFGVQYIFTSGDTDSYS